VSEISAIAIEKTRVLPNARLFALPLYVAPLPAGSILFAKARAFARSLPGIPRAVPASRSFDSLPPRHLARYLAGLTIYVAVIRRARFFNLAQRIAAFRAKLSFASRAKRFSIIGPD
jgi:hypothetical protein